MEMTGFPYSEEGAITSIAFGPLSSERWEPLLLVLSCIPIDDSFLLGMASEWDSELVSVPCSLFRVACLGGGSGASGPGVIPPRVTLGGRVLLSRLSDELLKPDWLVTSLLWSWLSR